MPMGDPSTSILGVMSHNGVGYGFPVAYYGASDIAYKVLGEEELTPQALNIHLLARTDKGTPWSSHFSRYFKGWLA